jgi:hypothetical protein
VKTRTLANSRWLVGKLVLFVMMSAVAANTSGSPFEHFDQQKYNINIPALNADQALNRPAQQTAVYVLMHRYSI